MEKCEETESFFHAILSYSDIYSFIINHSKFSWRQKYLKQTSTAATTISSTTTDLFSSSSFCELMGLN